MDKWMHASDYLELLRDSADIDFDDFFGLTKEVDLNQIFFVEVAYLNYWNQITKQLPDLEGINLECNQISYNCLEVKVTCNDKTASEIAILYTLISRKPTINWYAIEVQYRNQRIHLKLPSHNPMTEWDQNLLAEQNILDENSEPYFKTT